MSVPRRIVAAAIMGLTVVSGCTGGGRPASPAGGPASATPRSLDAAIETCTQADIGETGRPGKFVYLATDTTVQTQQGFEVVVHPAPGDTHGNRWRLVVTGGSSHLCRLNGNFIPSVIAAFIIRSPGIITLDATGPSGARRLTIRAGA